MDWLFLKEIAPVLGQGLWKTLIFTLLSSLIGLVIGIGIAHLQIAQRRILRRIGSAYVDVFRNLPLLVLLLWSYYALPIYLGLDISKEAAGLWALAFYAGAFYGEVLRGGLQAVDRTQREVCVTLGFSKLESLLYVIYPQALRASMPALVGQTIINMKNTTLLSVIGVAELSYEGSYLASQTYRPMEIYSVVGLCYLAILIPLNKLARYVERRYLGLAESPMGRE